MSRVIVWLRRRPFESWVTLAIVAGCVLFIWRTLYPDLLLANTTTNGGDLGAHVWGPAFLRDHLLPNLRLSGWTPDWYAGFPAYQFYMVVPGLFVVALDAIGITYNVAFKLVSVSGLLALPVCARWAMARMARQLLSGACRLRRRHTLAFVFDRSFSIYGGNALSTLAGEFGFTISLCFALLFLGAVARGLDTGKGRGSLAVLFALVRHPPPGSWRSSPSSAWGRSWSSGGGGGAGGRGLRRSPPPKDRPAEGAAAERGLPARALAMAKLTVRAVPARRSVWWTAVVVVVGWSADRVRLDGALRAPAGLYDRWRGWQKPHHLPGDPLPLADRRGLRPRFAGNTPRSPTSLATAPGSSCSR